MASRQGQRQSLLHLVDSQVTTIEQQPDEASRQQTGKVVAIGRGQQRVPPQLLGLFSEQPDCGVRLVDQPPVPVGCFRRQPAQGNGKTCAGAPQEGRDHIPQAPGVGAAHVAVAIRLHEIGKRFLKVFTFLEREEIERLEVATVENPKAREAQRALAHEVTTWVHGAEATAQAEAATSALWGRGDLADIDEATILAATSDLASGDVTVGQTTIVDLLVSTGLDRGRNAARKTIAGGGAYLNNVKVEDEATVIGPKHLLAGGVVLVRKGRRNLAVGRTV